MKTMKTVMALLALIAMAGVASATVADVAYNGGLETYADDGYGRIMPVGWGLYAQYDGWAGIPNVATTTADSHTGSAAFDMDLTTAWGDVAFIQNKGQLGADVQVGSYTVGAWIKGTITGGTLGFDAFSPDWSTWWGDGGADVTGTYADWTYVSHTFDVANGDANFNIRIKGATGSDFMVDDLSITTDIVPEPATIGLMGIAGIGMMIARRKTRG